MQIHRLFAAAALSTVALVQGVAQAHESIYTAPLLGSSESPASSSPAFGTATVTLDFDLLTMRVEATFSDLLGNVTASHIHCCTPTPYAGNVGVATMTPTFTGFPSGVKAGTYDHTFDMAQASSYNTAFVTANGGTVGSAFNALVAGLDSGKAYFNIHTSSFPGGEVRALLAPAPVPEPASYGLGLVGLGLMAGAARRVRKQA